MTTKAYISGLMTLIMSVWFVPDWPELFKVYVISTVAVTTVIMSLLFRIQKLREMIVKVLVADALKEILRDSDVQKLIETRLHRREFQERLGELRKENSDKEQNR